MDVSARDLIEQAMREIGVIAEGQEPSGDQYKSAIVKLRMMLESWQLDGLTPLLIIDDEHIPLDWPPGWLRAVRYGLAAEMASEYGVTVNAELMRLLSAARTQAQRMMVSVGRIHSGNPFGQGGQYDAYIDEFVTCRR